MRDLKLVFQEYFYDGLLPFVYIEGLVTLLATIVFFAQSNIMSANGQPNYVNVASTFVSSMGAFNILFAVSSVLVLIGLYINLKVHKFRYKRRKP